MKGKGFFFSNAFECERAYPKKMLLRGVRGKSTEGQ